MSSDDDLLSDGKGSSGFWAPGNHSTVLVNSKKLIGEGYLKRNKILSLPRGRSTYTKPTLHITY